MASRGVLTVRTACRKWRLFLEPITRVWAQTVRVKSPFKYLITSAVLFAHCERKEKIGPQDQDGPEAPEAANLSEEYLLKAASAQTADAVTTVLSQTAHSLIEAENKYQHTMDVLMQLLEHHLSVLGNQAEEDRVWDVILQGQARLVACKTSVTEKLVLFSCVHKLVEASAEVAFLAGSEFTSTSLGERLYNAQRHTDKARHSSQESEERLNQMQVHCVRVVAEHGEREEKKKQAKDDFFSGGGDGMGMYDYEGEEDGDGEKQPA